MAERLGEMTDNHQRELLSTIESPSGYLPPAMTSYSAVEIPKYEHIAPQKIEKKTGTCIALISF